MQHCIRKTHLFRDEETRDSSSKTTTNISPISPNSCHKFTEKFSHQYFNITHKTANPISRNSPTKAASERRKSDFAIRESCATLRQLQSMTDSCCSNRTEYRAVLGPRNIRRLQRLATRYTLRVAIYWRIPGLRSSLCYRLKRELVRLCKAMGPDLS